MSQIGPQMPPLLTKRKRTPDGDDQDSRRVRHASPKTHGPARPVAGPAMPPSVNADEIDLEDSDGDGPALPPQPAPVASASDDSDSDSDYGPALPGENDIAPAATPPPDSDDDDDPRLHGIRLPPAAAPAQRDDWMLAPPTDDGARAVDPTKIRARKFATGRAAVAAGMHGASGGAAASAIGSLWTETTEQKAQRLADTVLGRKPDPRQGGAATGDSGHHGHSAPRKTVAQEAQIKAYTEATRGRSLYETHQDSLKGGRKDEDGRREKDRDRDRDRDRHHSHRHNSRESRHESRHSKHDRHDKHDKHRRESRHDSDSSRRKHEKEDDPSARAFDREKDMGLGVHINHKQRRELLNRASDFGGRFQKGSYL